MSFPYNLTEATLLTDVTPNSTPSEFSNGVYALSRLMSAAHICPWSWQTNRRAAGVNSYSHIKNILYPVGMPVWGCQYGSIKVAVCYSCSGTNYSHISFLTPDDDTSDYSEIYSYDFQSWSVNRTDYCPKQTDWGMMLLYIYTDPTSTNQTAGAYMGVTNYSGSFSGAVYKPTARSSTDLMGDGCLPAVSSGILSAGFLQVAREYLTKLLDTPLHLWAHSCVPRGTDYCIMTYARDASSYSTPTGYVDPNVVTMPHMVPFREGNLPARCNYLHFAIWEHDYGRSASYQYRDFELWVEIGGVQYQATCIQCVDIDDVWANRMPGRLIMAQVQGPPDQNGSQMIDGRRYWTVRVARFGRQSYNDKGETNGMWTHDIGSISCWLGGESIL